VPREIVGLFRRQFGNGTVLERDKFHRLLEINNASI
jgi:hypothetical protein